MSLAALGLIVWGSLSYFGVIDYMPILLNTWGKWLFTVICTLLFFPWFLAFDAEDEVSARNFGKYIHSFKEQQGRLLGFLYESSGFAYFFAKLLLFLVLLIPFLRSRNQ